MPSEEIKETHPSFGMVGISHEASPKLIEAPPEEQANQKVKARI